MSLQIDWNNVHSSQVSRDESGQAIAHTPLIETMGFYLMFINIGEITEWNYLDVYARIHMRDSLLSALHEMPYPITIQQVRDCIGLKANVTPQSDRGFLEHLWDTYMNYLYHDNSREYLRCFDSQWDALQNYACYDSNGDIGVVLDRFEHLRNLYKVEGSLSDAHHFQSYKDTYNDDERVFIVYRKDGQYRMPTFDELEVVIEKDSKA